MCSYFSKVSHLLLAVETTGSWVGCPAADPEARTGGYKAVQRFQKASTGEREEREGRQPVQMHNQTGHGSGQLGFSPPRELWEFSVGPSRFVPLPGTGAERFIHHLPSVLCREPLPPRELQGLAVGIHQAEYMRRVLQ